MPAATPRTPPEPVIDVAALERCLLPPGRAWTLPVDAYTSAGVYALEVEHLFKKQWLCVARVDQVPQAGSYFSVDLLGHKLVIVRDRDGEVRCLSRICMHRASEIVKGAGRKSLLSCPYHEWSYALDGRLVSVPMLDGTEDFDKKTCQLPSYRVEVWGGFIFVNFDRDASPLASQLEKGFSAFHAPYQFDELVIAGDYIEYDSPYNWKILVENFMEAYHHIGTHKDSLLQHFPVEKAYVPDNHNQPWSILAMPHSDEGEWEAVFPAIETLTDWRREGIVASLVAPFNMFAMVSDSLFWYQVLPLAHDRFTLRIHPCVPRSTAKRDDLAAGMEKINAFITALHDEDHQANLDVWTGMTSHDFRQGRLTRHEDSIWQMNQWWCARIMPNVA
jgi:phenylpropionate dioxygenase-like ring-hydroxylating dioxygenase large terminal subunit